MITKLSILNFRNIKSADLIFDPCCNIISGTNGSGKTSLLEVIHYLGLGRSFRTRATKRIITHDAGGFLIGCQAPNEKITDTFTRVGIEKKRDGDSTIRVDGENLSSAARLADILPLQLINPECAELLLEGPSERRAFLDWGVFHVEHSFLTCWRDFKRVLAQRNALLRSGTGARHQLALWDKHYIELSERIDKMRFSYIDVFNTIFLEVIPQFLDFSIELNYRTGWKKGTCLEDCLLSNQESEFALGYTSSGPHRADLVFTSDGVPVSEVLSRGQLKLLVCALRLAQGILLQQSLGKHCIYLIDDLASELDQVNLTKVCNFLSQMNAQVFITTLQSDSIKKISYSFSSSKMFHVEHGVFQSNPTVVFD